MKPTAYIFQKQTFAYNLPKFFAKIHFWFITCNSVLLNISSVNKLTPTHYLVGREPVRGKLQEKKVRTDTILTTSNKMTPLVKKSLSSLRKRRKLRRKQDKRRKTWKLRQPKSPQESMKPGKNYLYIYENWISFLFVHLSLPIHAWSITFYWSLPW